MDGVVYFGGWDGLVYAVDALTGAERWRYKTDGQMGSSPAVVDGIVYIGSDDGSVYAIGGSSDADGASEARDGA